MNLLLSENQLIYYITLLVTLFGTTKSECLQDDSNSIDSSFDMSPHLQHISKFTIDFFKQVLPGFKKQNLFISPYTIWNGLALAYLGANGETEAQLQRVLGISSKVDTLKMWRAADYLYKMRQLQFANSHFGVVSKAYFQSGLNLRPCIRQILNSELEMIDFVKPQIAASVINAYVSEMTEGHISSIIHSSDIYKAQMALVNTAFFKDPWKIPFKKSETTKQMFYSYNGEEHLVKMMKRKGQFKHGVSKELGAHILELEYSMKDVSMFVFLPSFVEGEKGLDALLENMTVPVLEKAIQNIWLDNIDIAIPKISLSTTLGSDLKEALVRLGIRDLFNETTANLTSFVPEGGISVTKILHQTFLDINEEGTEAASSTVVIGTGRSARPSRLTSFLCDHPFSFVIYDKITKNILFIGVYHGE